MTEVVGDRGVCAEVVRAEVVETAIDAAAVAGAVARDPAGAVVTFEGVVRDHDGGRGVRELEYSAHPSANRVIGEITADIAGRSRGVRALSVVHRVGMLAIGDTAIVCAVSADHRGEAFRVCADLVDEVKKRLPVWKRQVFADGSEEWVNCP